jgi:hypothetical protein
VSAPNNKRTEHTTATTPTNDRTERIIYSVVIGVIAVVPLLTFVFSFGNVGDLGVSLHVDPRIAFLTGPAIDLSVVGLIVAGSYLSHRGWSEKQLWPIHAMSIICGLVMISLNCGKAIYLRRWGLAAFDGVGPLLLIGWGFLGPWLLQQLFTARGSIGTADVSMEPSADVSTPSIPAHPVSTPAVAASVPASDTEAAATLPPAVVATSVPRAPRRAAPGPIPIQRNDRLNVVIAMIQAAAGDLPLKAIEDRFGVSTATASRTRAAALVAMKVSA